MDLNKLDPKYNVYLDYLQEHIDNVNKCYELLTDECLDWVHDESKYSDEEFLPYAHNFYPETRPEGMTQEQVDKEYEEAWDHHKKNNPHHWQYWDGAPIPDVRYIYEMVADWASFAMKEAEPQNLLDWYETNKDTMILDSKTREIVEYLIDAMYEKLVRYFTKERA